MSNKSLLLISYYFPPQSNGGTGRPYALYKNFNSWGIRTIVICTDADCSFECIDNIYRGKYWKNYGLVGFFVKSMSYVLKKIGFVQFNDLFWQYSVYKKAVSLDESFDYIYTTYPTIDSLSIGRILAKKFGSKLIVEYRDSLTFESLEKFNFLQDKILKRFERNTLKDAFKVVTVGNEITAGLKVDSNAITIFNGYDEEDFHVINHEIDRLDKKTQLVHLGSISLSKDRSIENLIKALKICNEEQVLNENNFELIFIGNLTKSELRLFDKANVSHLVSIISHKPKNEALKIASQADCCLLFGVPNQKTYISSKLFDYIRLGKPILGICKGNEAEHIINENKIGKVYDFQVNDIVDSFKDLISGEILNNNQNYKKFDRSVQLKSLFDIIE